MKKLPNGLQTDIGKVVRLAQLLGHALTYERVLSDTTELCASNPVRQGLGVSGE